MSRSPIEILLLILAAAWRRRYLICIPILVLPPIAFVAAGFVNKAYETRMTILVQEPAKLNPFLNDLAIGPNLKERMPALKSLLHSEHVLGKVLEDVGVLKTESSAKERLWAVRRLSSAIKVRLVGSDLIELKIRRREKEGMVKTLKAVNRRFVERLLAPERSAVSDSEHFLEAQLKERMGILRKAEGDLAQYKKANAEQLPAIYSSNVTRLSAMKQRLDEKTMALAAADAAFDDLRKRVTTTNPVIGRLEENIVDITSQLSSLRARYTDSHSAVQAAERELKRLQAERRTILESAKKIDEKDLDRLWNMAAVSASSKDDTTQPLLVSQMQRLQDAQAKRAALQKDVELLKLSIADLQHKVSLSAPIEQEIEHHERSILMAREMYEGLNKRYQMARVTGALGHFEAPERIKVIDEPVAPVAPVTPGRMLFLIVGIVAGIGLGGGLAAVAEIFDTRIRRAKDFIDLTELPIIARVPRSTDVLELTAGPALQISRLPGLDPTIEG